MMRSLLLALVALVPATALAQNNAIDWVQDPAAAVALAQRTKRPIMAYAVASERYRDDQIDRDQKRAFRDPRVIAKSQRFIPLRMSRSRHRELLDQFGFPERANMVISFVNPSGEQIADISAQGITQVDSLLQKMNAVLEKYGQEIFATEVKPKLDDLKTPPGDLLDALRIVREFEIKSADEPIIQLLGRDRLPPNVRNAVYETLATLGTKTALEKLLELARGDDAAAAKALQQCTPAAAELMLAYLKPDAKPFDYVAYKTVMHICRVVKPKPERYFENSTQKMIEEEIQRVSDQVRTVAQRWKALNG